MSPTANTKGNKRSRTRTDSYTAGQSVGESTASCCPLNNVRTCLNLWLCGVFCRGSWGNRPWRDHAQETRNHGAWIHSLLQWVTSSFCHSICCCRSLSFFSARFTTTIPSSLAVKNDWCTLLCYCKAALKSTLTSFSCRDLVQRELLNLLFLKLLVVDASLFLFFLVGDGLVQPEALNKKAIQIINRVRDKLTGKFCSTQQTLPT